MESCDNGVACFSSYNILFLKSISIETKLIQYLKHTYHSKNFELYEQKLHKPQLTLTQLPPPEGRCCLVVLFVFI